MDHSDRGPDGRRYGEHGRTGPDVRKDRPPPQRGEVVRPEPIELVPTPVYAPAPPPGPPRNRSSWLVIALAVALVLVTGILIGVLVRPGPQPPPVSQQAASTTTATPRPTTRVPSTTSVPTATATPGTGAAPTSGAAGPVELTGITATEQLRVTPGGQDLDGLVGDDDQADDVRFAPSDNEFNFLQTTALWPEGPEPTVEGCARQLQLQPLSGNERANLSNNPLVSACAYTSDGNIAHVRVLDSAQGDGVQMSVTVWQTVD